MGYRTGDQTRIIRAPGPRSSLTQPERSIRRAAHRHRIDAAPLRRDRLCGSILRGPPPARRGWLQGDVYDTAAARPILRGGGSGDYFEISPDHLFRLTRPREQRI